MTEDDPEWPALPDRAAIVLAVMSTALVVLYMVVRPLLYGPWRGGP